MVEKLEFGLQWRERRYSIRFTLRLVLANGQGREDQGETGGRESGIQGKGVDMRPWHCSPPDGHRSLLGGSWGGSKKMRNCDDQRDKMVGRKVAPLANTKTPMCGLEHVRNSLARFLPPVQNSPCPPGTVRMKTGWQLQSSFCTARRKECSPLCLPL